MRRLLAMLLVGVANCQLVFPLEVPPEGPPPKRPFGCSPASLLTDTFDDPLGPLGRPWFRVNEAAVTAALETASGLQLDVQFGFTQATAELFLELREQEFSVTVGHLDGTLLNGDRATLDLLAEDGRHRLSYGLVADSTSTFRLVAEVDTFDTSGNIAGTSLIGSTSHTSNDDPVELVIRHSGEVTTFLAADPTSSLQEKFATDLAPLEWIGYVRPSSGSPRSRIT